MTRQEERALSITEDLGAWLTDIQEELNRIRWDPEGATDKDLENLERIKEHMAFIERLAKDTLKA